MQLNAFAQGIMEQSATKKAAFGQLRITSDGRKYRYAYAVAAHAAGQVGRMAQGTANHVNRSAATTAKGATEVVVGVGATAVTADQYTDGYLQIYDGTAGTVGHQYRITGHTTHAGSGNITVQLEEPLRTALIATTDKLSLIPNPWSSVAVGDALARGAAGVAPIAVTIANYYWSQTGGMACVLNQGNTAMGTLLNASVTAGAVISTANGTSETSPSMGFQAGYTGDSTKYSPIFLTID